MSFCGKCGTQVPDNTQFCPSCGATIASDGQQAPQQAASTAPPPTIPPQAPPAQPYQPAAPAPVSEAQDIANNKFMAVLAYLGILVLIPWFAAPQSKFARFHAKQGITLALAEVAYMIVSFLLGLIKTTHYFAYVPYRATPWYITLLIFLLGIPLSILAIIGIVNAVKGRFKELPIIGKIKIVK